MSTEEHPNIDDLIELPAPGDPQISPGGEWIAYTLRKPDWKENEHTNQIWLAPSLRRQSAPDDFCQKLQLFPALVSGWRLAGLPVETQRGRAPPNLPHVVFGWGSRADEQIGNGRAAMILADAGHYAEVVVFDLQAGEFRRLTGFDEQTREWKLGRYTVLQWTSPDGIPLDGVLTYPPDFDPQLKYPLLVVIHGGPTSISLSRSYPPPSALSTRPSSGQPKAPWCSNPDLGGGCPGRKRLG